MGRKLRNLDDSFQSIPLERFKNYISHEKRRHMMHVVYKAYSDRRRNIQHAILSVDKKHDPDSFYQEVIDNDE